MILGMDFMLKFDIDLRNKRYLWRANGGPWHSSKLEEVDGKPLMYAECAGISTCGPDELHKVEQLVNRCLPDDDPSPGVTNRSEHHIRVNTSTPVRHHLRRMSPKMEEVARAEVTRLAAEGFIEQSASDWCSAPCL
ncbi:unnamed protein product [Trichogramma brassicae]|uniref:Reverse transcriptase domain-containing protein n=1 Tax=Trichogramma brassicae TaxID=86971 RepID=A0A6H5IT99_9HYME|nr:unnamed protein product [Trichogramma brassicae]